MGEEKNKKKKVNESFRIESTVTRFIVCSEGGLMSRNQKNIEKEKQVFFLFLKENKFGSISFDMVKQKNLYRW